LSASLLAGIALGALAALTAMAALFKSAAAFTFSYPQCSPACALLLSTTVSMLGSDCIPLKLFKF